MKIPMLDLKAQYARYRAELKVELDTVYESQQFILGPKVRQFEAHFAAYCKSGYAVGLSSGTDALLAALMALGIGPGDAVVTSPYSFYATVGSIVRLGAVPWFADIDPVTFNLDPSCVRRVLETPPKQFKDKKPKAIMPVHLFGQSADMDDLLALGAEYDCRVIEDAAQAIGAEYPAKSGVRKAGSMGDIGCFSFFPSKNLGGFGDGGMAVTNDKTLAETLKAIRVHGSLVKYRHIMIGGNFRLDELQAAVLDVKLKYLEEWLRARRRNAMFYNRAFKGSSVRVPQEKYASSGVKNAHTYCQYVVRVPDRDRVRDGLKAEDVGCEIYYPIPLHFQECFQNLGYQPGDLPEAEKACTESLALPIYPELTEAMLQQVVNAVLKYVKPQS